MIKYIRVHFEMGKIWLYKDNRERGLQWFFILLPLQNHLRNDFMKTIRRTKPSFLQVVTVWDCTFCLSLLNNSTTAVY